MGLRPAHTIREYQGQPWARISQKKPRKSFVKGAPRPKVRQYNMGVDKRFEVEADLVADGPIQLRDNALEAARQSLNKHLEKTTPGNYFIQLLKYPHLVIRESAALGVAGADRISKGMKRAFGRPKGRMARVKAGDPLFRIRTVESALPAVRVAANRAVRKLSGSYTLAWRDIRQDAKNLARSIEGKAFELKLAEAPKAAAAEAAPAAEGKEGAAAEVAKGGEAKTEKGAKEAGKKEEKK